MNTLAVEELRDDCDGDALLVRVRPAGPVCHTGSLSCFAPALWRTVAQRALERPAGSYTAELLNEGVGACARKVGEEAVELTVAALDETDERVLEEAADLVFHLYVLLAARGPRPGPGRRRARSAGAVALSCLTRGWTPRRPASRAAPSCA